MIRKYTISAMTPDDDFNAYERFVAMRMKPGDYYTAQELESSILSKEKTAWWARDENGKVIGWCAITHENKDFAGSCNFFGVAVDENYANTVLALRMIRIVLKAGQDRPMTCYIQPGVETERLIKPLGFIKIGFRNPWKVYMREAKA